MGSTSESLPEEKKTLRPDSVDYALAGIAPAFIIGMIGSLTFFLITLFYRGEYPARLMWILGLYTFAAVLIARIAIEQSRTYSMGYMVGLGAATLLVAPRFVAIQGPMGWLTLPFLVFFLVLIAFLADRITFDCTSINEADASSGIGLLQSLGLNRADSYQKSSELQSRPGAYLKQRKKHNPGVWVLYFALMVLPLFGVGQLFIRDEASRSFSQRLLFIYLFCTLSLLVLISLLSLRKYLREREIEMEPPFAIRWLSIGIASVTVLLVVFALLPIPSQSLWSWDLPLKITSRDNLQAHKMGWGDQGVKNPEAIPPQAHSGEQPDASNGGSGKRAKEQNEDGRRPGEGKPGNQNQGQLGEQGKQGQRDQGQTGEQEQKNKNGTGTDGDSGQQQSTVSKKDGKSQTPNESQEKGTKGEQTSNPPQGKQGAQENDNGKQQQPQQANQPAPEKQQDNQPPPEQQQVVQQRQAEPVQRWDIQWNPGPILQWFMVLILLVIAVVLGVKHRKAILQFINSLLGRNQNSEESRLVESPATIQELFPPFLSFQNPFASQGVPSEQMVRQMFRALQSWGYEHRIVRSAEETPDEYVRRLGRRYPEQSQNLISLGMLYSRIAYARGRVAQLELAPLQELWVWLKSQRSA